MLLGAHADGVSQVVNVAAGMDARSFRLPWPDGVTIYEVDQPQVIAIKEERLAGARPRCQRVAVGVDLADDWPKTLQSQGFNSSTPTVWTIEGLLQYIEAPDVDRLFARVDALSAPGTVLLYDVVGKALLEVPFLQNTIEFMQKLGAPWVFGSDTPGALVEGRGWSATVTDMAVPGNAWKRWEHPALPADVPNSPRGYFVEAVKARGVIRRRRLRRRLWARSSPRLRCLYLGRCRECTYGRARALPRVASGSTPSPRSSRIERRRFR